jgi:pimeloyl-ACP methyl ester carboxylesterase
MTNWMTGVCETNGINIHYRRTGRSKPPLVLLHGLAGSGACWIPLARALEGEYDVVMPDARGHGNSSTPLDGYRYEDYASDVVGLIQGLGLAAPVLLGHSMGGMTAALVASQLATAIRGVILADPDVLRPPNPEYHQLVISTYVPILLVIGDHGVVSLETAQELQKLNPRLRVEQIPNAGHGVHYDQPESFEAAVRSFLRSAVAS